MPTATLDSLCAECREYLDNLPTWESDTRMASLIACCLAYECEDYHTDGI